jgi:hypothetical protein
MQMVLKALSLLLFAAGAFVIFLAGKIEEKYRLRSKETVKEAEHFEEKEIDEMKRQKAVLRVKLYGLVFLLPGLFGILILFE